MVKHFLLILNRIITFLSLYAEISSLYNDVWSVYADISFFIIFGYFMCVKTCNKKEKGQKTHKKLLKNHILLQIIEDSMLSRSL